MMIDFDIKEINKFLDDFFGKDKIETKEQDEEKWQI